MATATPESAQLSNNFAQKNDKGVGEIIIETNGNILSEATQIQSTQNVELSNNLGELHKIEL